MACCKTAYFLIYLDIAIGEFMPRYDYKCSVCSSQIEFEKKFDEERFPVCCNQSMQRLWSATTAIFNGSGFYSTDNRK